MKQCPNCKKPVADTSKFCPSCGAAIPDIPQVAQSGGFCPTCGGRVPAGESLCPNCGAVVSRSQPQAPVPPTVEAPYQAPYQASNQVPYQPSQFAAQPPKKSGGKVGIILAVIAAVVALAVVGVMFIPKLFRSPEKEFVSYQQEAVVSPLLALLESREELVPVREVSTDMTLSLNIDQPDYQQLLEDTSLVLKVDSDGSKVLMNADAILMGSPVLSGAVTYEDGQFGFCLPELDENYYVMDLAQLLTRLTGEEIELGEAKIPEASGKEWAALAQTYLDLVYTVVTKENVALEKRAEFTLDEVGERYTGDVYTFTPTAADVEAMLNKLADHLEEDQDLRSLILKLVDEEMLLEAIDFQYDSLEEALADAAQELRNSAAEEGKYLEENSFTWTLYMEGKTIRMIRWASDGGAVIWEQGGSEKDAVQVLYGQPDGGDREVVYRNTCTKDGGNSQGELTFGAEGSTITVNYRNSGSQYKGTATLVSGGDWFDVTYSLDREKRSILGIPYGTLTLSEPTEDITVTFRVEEGPSGGTDHVIAMESDSLFLSEGFSQVELTINTTEKGTATAPTQTPEDITSWSEDELEELIDELTYGLYGQLLGQVGSLLYGF